MRVFLSVLLLFVFSGCGEQSGSNEEPEIPLAKPQQEKPALPEAEVLKTGPAKWEYSRVILDLPKGWKQVELTQKQQGLGFYEGRFYVPAVGRDWEMTVSITAGGSESNIGRWKDQFPVKNPNVEQIDISGGHVTLVELIGELQAGKTSEDDQRMLGVAIPIREGEDSYLKLVGSEAALQSLRKDFREFAGNIQLTP